MKLGSLFDGSGGFPLAATRCGIEPVWASEVEPYPIAVTRSHFPAMVHLGDVATISGATIEPVDVITFGSPCQDLSVCGKQAGLDGKRSSLFFQAVRIIKEMRIATNGEKPRFAIWENVLGALFSNGGDDFARVLSEFMAVDGLGSVARFNDGWKKAGAIVGDRFSLAWRVLDAQFWGVPQCRRRVFLVVDFRGHSATRILFKQTSKTGSIEQSKKIINKTSRFNKKGFECFGIEGRLHYVKDKAPALRAQRVGSVIYGEIARRITPNEAGRLQGFPKNWGKIGAINEKEFPFWREVWTEYSRVFKTKERTDASVLKWMKNPYSKAREYEMWGNGVALPCVEFILNAMTND